MADAQAISWADLRAIENNLNAIHRNLDVLNSDLGTVNDNVATVYKELGALAEEFHFSKNHILARFKAGYGSTPFQYLRLLRLREARRMLEVTSLPLEQIATEAGFGDYSYFYRCFIEDTGVSPARWRRQHRV